MKKNKEHKKGESTIGKIIYGFLLFMPLFAIGVTCGYAMFNKNAYQSYALSNEISLKNVVNTSSMVEGKQYLMSSYKNAQTGVSNYYGFTSIQTNLQQYFEGIEPLTNFGVWIHTNGGARFSTFQNNTQIFSTTTFTYNTLPDVIFTSDGVTIQSWGTTPNPNYDLFIYVDSVLPISNVFYYAVDKVTESPLFSWATNSVIYTTMNATCTQLSITAPFIPLLLSYWLIISVIYFLYDIALMLIWLLHDKIHEMRDSLA